MERLGFDGLHNFLLFYDHLVGHLYLLYYLLCRRHLYFLDNFHLLDYLRFHHHCFPRHFHCLDDFLFDHYFHWDFHYLDDLLNDSFPWHFHYLDYLLFHHHFPWCSGGRWSRWYVRVLLRFYCQVDVGLYQLGDHLAEHKRNEQYRRSGRRPPGYRDQARALRRSI